MMLKKGCCSIKGNTCSCGHWNWFGYPCPHMLRLFDEIRAKAPRELAVLYSYKNAAHVHTAFHAATWLKQTELAQVSFAYDEESFPVGKIDEVRLWLVRPVGKGRPKTTKRIKPIGLGKKAVNCSYCRQPGHNRRSCRVVVTDVVQDRVFNRQSQPYTSEYAQNWVKQMLEQDAQPVKNKKVVDPKALLVEGTLLHYFYFIKIVFFLF